MRRRNEIPTLAVEQVEQGTHISRVIAAYEGMIAGKPEAAILRALGYFNRPAETEALKMVLPKMEDLEYQAALIRLHDARLILTADPAQPLDCHPLIREHFAVVATPEGHARLYEHYKTQAPKMPDTLEGMTPLIFAVYHGCKAGQHQAALNDVFWSRIERNGQGFLARNLGAFGTKFSLLANFFLSPWTQPMDNFSLADREWVLGNSGFALHSIGRVAEAIESCRAAAECCVESGEWARASTRYGNLSSYCLILGNIIEALASARLAVDFADRDGNWSYRSAACTTLAVAVHQAGDVAEARRLFEDAERLRARSFPQSPTLNSVPGYHYCDLLLDLGLTADVFRHSRSGTFELIDEALDRLTLARVGSAEASRYLDQAIEYLRHLGALHFLTTALLTRGKPCDRDDAFRIATRSGMRLHLADYHLAMARCDRSREHFEMAESLIAETGYHRRDAELEQLRAELAG